MIATRRRLLFTILILAAVFLVSLGVYVWFKRRLDVGDVPLLKTPAWEFNALDDGQLMLRRDTEAGGALLLKRTNLETVYRYEPQTRSISAVADAAWQKATGQIAKCVDQRYGSPLSVLNRNDRNHKLFAGEREVRTAGGIAPDRNDFLEPCWSADEKFVV